MMVTTTIILILIMGYFKTLPLGLPCYFWPFHSTLSLRALLWGCRTRMQSLCQSSSLSSLIRLSW